MFQGLDNGIDYEFKQFVIEFYPGYLKLENWMRCAIFKKSDLNLEKIDVDLIYNQFPCLSFVKNFNWALVDKMYLFLSHNNLVFRECIKMNHARNERVSRLKNRISFYLNNFNNVYFITLTFSDDHMNNSADTRRKYISRYLKKFSKHYVANIDFGGKNGREHYHAVAVICPIARFFYKLGYCDFKHVDVFRDSSEDSTKLAKYINKLTNHAFKESVQRRSLLYSRDKFVYKPLKKGVMYPDDEQLQFDFVECFK